MKVEELFENKLILEEYRKIDEQNAVLFSHGLKHVRNVVEVMRKLTDSLGIVGENKDDLEIAAFLHDVGQVDGRKDHGEKGAKIAEKILRGKISEQRLTKILDGITFHDEKEMDKLPIFTNLLSFADKMDFTRERIDEDWKNKVPYGYLEKLGKNIYKHIISVDFIKNKTTFIIDIKTDGQLTPKDIIERSNKKGDSFFPKMVNSSQAVAKKLNLKLKIKLDSAEVF